MKAYSITSGDAGDTLPTTVTVTNAGSVTAYDVVLTDLTPSQLTAGVGYSGTIAIGTLNPGDSRIYTYNSTINSSVYPADILTGTASILYTSYP